MSAQKKFEEYIENTNIDCFYLLDLNDSIVLTTNLGIVSSVVENEKKRKNSRKIKPVLGNELGNTQLLNNGEYNKAYEAIAIMKYCALYDGDDFDKNLKSSVVVCAKSAEILKRVSEPVFKTLDRLEFKNRCYVNGDGDVLNHSIYINAVVGNASMLAPKAVAKGVGLAETFDAFNAMIDSLEGQNQGGELV